MSQQLPDGTIVTQLDHWDPRTPHTEHKRWYFELSNGDELEFIGRVHTEIGTRVYSLQTAAQRADPDWIHTEHGGAEHIAGTAVGEVVSFRASEGSIYSGTRRLWVAPARTVSIHCRDTSQVPQRTVSSWWYCVLADGTQWLEEQFPWGPEWDWTTPMGQFWRLDRPHLKRPYYSPGLKQVGEVLAYRCLPFASSEEAHTEDGPLPVRLGTIVHSFPVEYPATWPQASE